MKTTFWFQHFPAFLLMRFVSFLFLHSTQTCYHQPGTTLANSEHQEQETGQDSSFLYKPDAAGVTSVVRYQPFCCQYSLRPAPCLSNLAGAHAQQNTQHACMARFYLLLLLQLGNYTVTVILVLLAVALLSEPQCGCHTPELPIPYLDKSRRL